MQAVAAAANEDPFRAYTPSYSSFTSSFEENVFPSTLPNAQQGLQQQQQQQQPQQQSLGIHQPQPVQGWRDRGIYDDSYSLYSTSSISRSTSPAISSFHGTPAMQPADHQPFEVTGSPSPFAPPPNVISPQPALWSLGPSMAERDATVQFPQSRSQSFTATGSRDATMGPPTQQHPDPHPSGATNFLGQGLSTSPTASPRIQFQDVSSTASGGNGSYPKTGSLSKLDIPCTPSIDVEAATATAGPGTARPGAHISTQLDRMIAQSQGVSSLLFFHARGLDAERPVPSPRYLFILASANETYFSFRDTTV